MIGLLRDGVRKIGYCDKRPYSETEKRFWSLAALRSVNSTQSNTDRLSPVRAKVEGITVNDTLNNAAQFSAGN